MFAQQLLLDSGNQRFPGGRGGGRRGANVTDQGLSRRVTLHKDRRHSLCALVQICDHPVGLLLQPLVDVVEVFWHLRKVEVGGKLLSVEQL